MATDVSNAEAVAVERNCNGDASLEALDLTNVAGIKACGQLLRTRMFE